MEDEKTKPEPGFGEVQKRLETMADGRRYIIYYTFGEDEKARPKTENDEVK